MGNYVGAWTPGFRGGYWTQSGTPTINTSIERGEGASIEFNPATTATEAIQLGATMNTGTWNDNTYPIDAADVSVRAYAYFTSAPASGSEEIFGLQNTSFAWKCFLRINSSRQLVLYSGNGTSVIATGTFALSLNTWYRIEIYIGTGTTASYRIKVYSDADTPVQLESLTGTANFTTGNGGWYQWGKITNRGGQGFTVYLATFNARNDSSECGHCKGKVLLPNGNGFYTGWTGSYTDCDELPTDNDTTFASTNVANTSECYDLQSLTDVGLVGTETIKCFQAGIVTRVTSSAITSQANVLVRSGSTDSLVNSGRIWGTGYGLKGSCLENDPNTGLAWTPSGINAVQVGCRTGSSLGVNTLRMTSVYGYIEYVPVVVSTSQHPEMFNL